MPSIHKNRGILINLTRQLKISMSDFFTHIRIPWIQDEHVTLEYHSVSVYSYEENRIFV